MAKERKRPHGCLKCCSVLIVLIVGVFIQSYISDWQEDICSGRQLQAFDAVVSEIKRGSLQPDKFGVYTLPPRFAGLTTTHRVYKSIGDGDPWALFFPTVAPPDEYSKPHGFIYCPGHLQLDSRGAVYLYFQDDKAGSSMQIMVNTLELVSAYHGNQSRWYWGNTFS